MTARDGQGTGDVGSPAEGGDFPRPSQECPACRAPAGKVQALPCGHGLCEACSREVGGEGCTVCYGARLTEVVLDTLLNLLFPDRTTAAAGSEGGAEVCRAGAGPGVCVEHDQPLSVFCQEDEQPGCEQCRRDEHLQHQCCSIQQAVLDCKRELRSAMRTLQDQVDNLTIIRDSWQEMVAHIKSQSDQVSQLLREEFEKMHQYLRDEEAAMMSSLKQDEEEKSRQMKEKLDSLGNDIRELTSALRETETVMTLEDYLFLKNYKKASERAGCNVEEPEEEAGVLLDVAQHRGNLQHRVWEKMLSITQFCEGSPGGRMAPCMADVATIVPVILDPNTASAGLRVSDDLAGVAACEEQQLPGNPERLTCELGGVLGAEAWSSGRHSWEVEVGGSSSWSLGVAQDGPGGPAPRLWTLSLASGEYLTRPGPGAPLWPGRRPRRVRVQLDWERGVLTFSDAGDNSLLHRVKERWSAPLRLYMATACSTHPLNLAAGRVTVTAE